jgi:hypothetical protein
MNGWSFYIASCGDNLRSVELLSEHLERQGMHNAFPWHEHLGHACSYGVCGIDNRSQLARHELIAAGTCMLFIGITRLGRGSHVELGAALRGPARRIVLIGVKPEDSVFYCANGVEIFDTLEDALRVLGVSQ